MLRWGSNFLRLGTTISRRCLGRPEWGPNTDIGQPWAGTPLHQAPPVVKKKPEGKARQEAFFEIEHV